MSINHLMTDILIFMELASFITGLVYWKKAKNTIWVWFVIYLGFIVCGELISNYLHYYSPYKYDVNKIYNYIILPGEFLFLYWLYYKHSQSKRSELLVILCIIIYLASFAADQYFFQGKNLFSILFLIAWETCYCCWLFFLFLYNFQKAKGYYITNHL